MFATSALIYKSSDVTDMELFDVDSSYISIGVFAMCEKWMMNGRGIIPFPPAHHLPAPAWLSPRNPTSFFGSLRAFIWFLSPSSSSTSTFRCVFYRTWLRWWLERSLEEEAKQRGEYFKGWKERNRLNWNFMFRRGRVGQHQGTFATGSFFFETCRSCGCWFVDLTNNLKFELIILFLFPSCSSFPAAGRSLYRWCAPATLCRASSSFSCCCCSCL